jgi:hypothetical protein
MRARAIGRGRWRRRATHKCSCCGGGIRNCRIKILCEINDKRRRLKTLLVLYSRILKRMVFVDYSCPRYFVHESKLRSYLALKKPSLHYATKDTITVQEVISKQRLASLDLCLPSKIYISSSPPQILESLKEIICEERLYDDRNASIVLCDADLELALNVKAVHLTQLRLQTSPN